MKDKTTCADCEHHECTSLCMKYEKPICDGKCTKNDIKINCQRIHCEHIKKINWSEEK